jgi:single-strand DNA-binding protein
LSTTNAGRSSRAARETKLSVKEFIARLCIVFPSMTRSGLSRCSGRINRFSARARFHTLPPTRRTHRAPRIQPSKENFMNSFNVTAVGNLAKNPELNVKGETTFTRFCLVGNDYAGKDEEGNVKEIVTSLYFVAFGGLGEAIARNARKGDQLIVGAHIRADNWTDKEGEMQYDHSFVADTFRFGAPGKAKREELARREDHAVES